MNEHERPLADRITQMPRAYEADRGHEARTAAAWANGPMADLIEGAGGSSPYLKGLIEKEAGWLEAAVERPEEAMTALREGFKDTGSDNLATDLRVAKRRAALLIALCDLGGAWTLHEVTSALTDFADAASQAALEHAISTEIRRGKLPGAGEDDIATAGGMVTLAMGKMGAHELNYSSDIDLICLYDETRFDPDDYHEARSSFVRATRKMASLLNDLTGDGYVFRTDLRLRPDPAVTPVCIAMEAAERYYESLGRTWERAAYIKARPSAGDLTAGARFLGTLRPFIWRKHLDFAAIEDAHNMRLRIREAKGLHGPITLPGHNMKLGRGGIREIEFFTQTRQLIAGGRDADLRVRGTVQGLDVLAQKGWVPPEAAQTLSGHYEFHRTVEHRIQMIGDAQTHDLPKSEDGFERLACLMGVESAALEDELRSRLTEVHGLTEGFFAPDSSGVQETLPKELTGSDIPSRWPTYPALRSERAGEIFQRLRPEILRRLGEAARPEEALAAFDGFLAGLPAGVQLFSLFEANPQLIDLLVDITDVSPDLGRYLARNASVFDAVIGGDFFSPWPGSDALRIELAAKLEAEADYERCLDLTRRWGKEWHFRVGVHLLRGLMDAEEAGRAYADLAEATLAALWPVVQAEFSRKHGVPPGRGAVVVGMGSLGAARLHARSDLDVIVIYDPQDVEASDGRRPLPSRTYYARLTQALITAMTAPMAEGRLYEMDMRLRPSGNQGPVATSLTAFKDYQRNQAWVWEHLALTRARVVAGPSDLAQDVGQFRLALLSDPRERADILSEVSQMRTRIAAAKSSDNQWDAKIGAGRMQDVELLAQAASLLAGTAERQTAVSLRNATWIPEQDVAALIEAYDFFWALQLGSKLVSDDGVDPETMGPGGRGFLDRLTGCNEDSTLAELVLRHASKAGQIIDNNLADYADTGDSNVQG